MTNAGEFFSSEVFTFPLDRNAGDFEAFVRETLAKYVAAVDALPGGDPVLDGIKAESQVISAVAADITATIENRLNGRPSNAERSLYTAIERVLPHLGTLFTEEISEYLNNLYRVRKSDEPLKSKSELFHIPLHKRHLVDTQRFSLPGVPCLYLGGSLYVCWEELQRPDVDRLYACHYRLLSGQSVNLLDLGFRPDHIARFVTHRDRRPDYEQQIVDRAISYGVCWPLIAASSVRVQHRDAPFKPEYIIPQLLLQWVAERGDHDGIRYPSMHTPTCGNTIAISNFVFPAKSRERFGPCPRLRSLFEMTEPISWQTLDLVPVPSGVLPRMFQIEIVEGLVSDYLYTRFGENECKLHAIPHAQVDLDRIPPSS